MTAMIVRADQLTKRYGAINALSGLSFEIPRGEVFGFIGPNGAGKTTTLRILAGLSRPNSGTVEIDGIDVAGKATRLRELTGYMPDFFGVYDSMTAAEYLAFYASCYRAPKRSIAKVVDDLLQLVGLGTKRDAQVDTLSRGMKQRLCLARALVHDPEVLLLDEPASGLDPRARAEMRELVGALSEMGKTILLSSHILPELAEMCTSFGIVHEGRMVACGPARSVLSGTGPRRARARVHGDIDEAERAAGAIEGVLAVTRSGPDTLEISHSGQSSDDAGPGAAALLRSLVLAGVAVTDFRQDDGDLEQLFLQLTGPGEGVPGEDGPRPPEPATGPAGAGPAGAGPAGAGPAGAGPAGPGTADPITEAAPATEAAS
jgi:ABC-2 type transport system ATP-binding protein